MIRPVSWRGRRVLIACALAASACSSSTPRSAPSSSSSSGPSLPTTTAAPPASATTTATTPPVDRALDLAPATAFGFAPGQFVAPEALFRALRPILGAPTRDTGWYVTPEVAQPGGAQDCLGHRMQRILRWGNLSYAFWKGVVAGRPESTQLWSWTIGATEASGEGDRREPHPIVEQPVIAATTADGIGVGTSLTVLQRRFGSSMTIFDDRKGAFLPSRNSAGAHVIASLAGDVVTGVGATLSFC